MFQQSWVSLMLFFKVIWRILSWAHLYQNCLSGNSGLLGHWVPVASQILFLWAASGWVSRLRTNFYIDVFLHHACRLYFLTPNSCSTWPWGVLVSQGSLFPPRTPSRDNLLCQWPGQEGRDFIATFYWDYCSLRIRWFLFSWGSQLSIRFSDPTPYNLISCFVSANEASGY